MRPPRSPSRRFPGSATTVALPPRRLRPRPGPPPRQSPPTGRPASRRSIPPSMPRRNPKPPAARPSPPPRHFRSGLPPPQPRPAPSTTASATPASIPGLTPPATTSRPSPSTWTRRRMTSPAAISRTASFRPMTRSGSKNSSMPSSPATACPRMWPSPCMPTARLRPSTARAPSCCALACKVASLNCACANPPRMSSWSTCPARWPPTIGWAWPRTRSRCSSRGWDRMTRLASSPSPTPPGKCFTPPPPVTNTPSTARSIHSDRKMRPMCRRDSNWATRWPTSPTGPTATTGCS